MALESDEGRAQPATQPATQPIQSEFPPSIGKVARRSLAQHGYIRWDQLTTVTRAELLRIHGVGPKSVGILEEELASRELSFKSP